MKMKGELMRWLKTRTKETNCLIGISTQVSLLSRNRCKVQHTNEVEKADGAKADDEPNGSALEGVVDGAIHRLVNLARVGHAHPRGVWRFAVKEKKRKRGKGERGRGERGERELFC
jgi:hypothetical protein